MFKHSPVEIAGYANVKSFRVISHYVNIILIHRKFKIKVSKYKMNYPNFIEKILKKRDFSPPKADPPSEDTTSPEYSGDFGRNDKGLKDFG